MKSQFSRLKLGALSVLVAIPSFNINAATVNGTLGVTATVGAGCQVNNSNVTSGIVDFGTLNFGSINTVGAANIDAQTTGGGSGGIVMECSNGTPFTITLDNGLHFAGGTRAMANASAPSTLLSYTLYQNAARALPWTVGTPLTSTANGAPTTFNVYGRIPGGQSGISAGNYSDTIQVVITW